MRNVIRGVGLIWAGIGVWTLYSIFTDPTMSDAGQGFALFVTFFLFILPGLLLAK